MITEDMVLEALRAHAGIDAAQTGEVSLRKEIRRAIAACPHPHRLLDTSSPEWSALLESALVPETWFFRNIEAFDALAGWVATSWLPAHPDARLRVLSLPCATGEEPYSIAMRLLEAGLPPDRFTVRAGDISPVSLAAARRGVFSRNSFRTGFDEARFGNFFEPLGDGRRKVTDRIRQLVEFQTINLADRSATFPPSDVIFCRNALIYFADDTRRDVLVRLCAALADDGILFLGPVEPPVALECGFATAGIPMAFACVKAGSRPAPSVPVQRPLRKVSRQVDRVDRAKPKPRPARAPAAPSPPPTADSLESARALADAGEEAKAADMLERLGASLAPTPELFCLRGVVSDALGRSDLAEASYRKALYLDPDHAESLAQLALLLELRGRPSHHLRRRALQPR
jgi:chemotaxis protein methyltransferase WspC